MGKTAKKKKKQMDENESMVWVEFQYNLSAWP